jgi:CRISPR type III-A-associated protein Csm2
MPQQQKRYNGRHNRSGSQAKQNGQLSEEEKQKILAGDAATIDQVAERFAKKLKDLNRTQMRNFYTPFTRIRANRKEQERKNAIIQHRARTAYLVAREKKAEPIWDLFGDLLNSAKDDDLQIDALCDLAEALIAYHRRESSERGEREQPSEE